MSELCSICGDGHLRAQRVVNSVEYRAEHADLELDISVCDACGSEQADASQLRSNKRAMNAFKKHVDGLLTGAEVRALREKLGLSQAEAARVFGGGPVAFSKYEADDVSQSESMDKLLRLAGELPMAFRRLRLAAGLSVPGGSIQWGSLHEWRMEPSLVSPKARPKLRLVRSTPNANHTPKYATA